MSDNDEDEALREAHAESVEEARLRGLYEEGSPEWDAVHPDPENEEEDYSDTLSRYQDNQLLEDLYTSCLEKIGITETLIKRLEAVLNNRNMKDEPILETLKIKKYQLEKQLTELYEETDKFGIAILSSLKE